MSRRDTRGSNHDLPLDLDLDDPPPSQSGSPVPARSTQPPPPRVTQSKPAQGKPAQPKPAAKPTPAPAKPRQIDPSATIPGEVDAGLEDDAVPFDLTPPPPKQATPPPQSRQSPEPAGRANAKGAPRRRPADDMPEVPSPSSLRRPVESNAGRGVVGIALIALVVLGCAGGTGVLAIGGWLYTRPVAEVVPVEVVPAVPEPPPPTELDGIPIEKRLREDPNGAPPAPRRPDAP